MGRVKTFFYIQKHRNELAFFKLVSPDAHEIHQRLLSARTSRLSCKWGLVPALLTTKSSLQQQTLRTERPSSGMFHSRRLRSPHRYLTWRHNSNLKMQPCDLIKSQLSIKLNCGSIKLLLLNLMYFTSLPCSLFFLFPPSFCYSSCSFSLSINVQGPQNHSMMLLKIYMLRLTLLAIHL